MKSILLLCLAVGVFARTDLSHAGPILSNDDYRDIREIAKSIEAEFPVDKYVYVSISRTPTPLIRFFQELALGVAYNYIPRADLRRGRTILLIDYASSETGLGAALQRLKKEKIHGLALAASEDFRQVSEALRGSRFSLFALDRYPEFLKKAQLNYFNPYSEFSGRYEQLGEELREHMLFDYKYWGTTVRILRCQQALVER